jgi:hypothetical protein
MYCIVHSVFEASWSMNMLCLLWNYLLRAPVPNSYSMICMVFSLCFQRGKCDCSTCKISPLESYNNARISHPHGIGAASLAWIQGMENYRRKSNCDIKRMKVPSAAARSPEVTPVPRNAVRRFVFRRRDPLYGLRHCQDWAVAAAKRPSLLYTQSPFNIRNFISLNVLGNQFRPLRLFCYVDSQTNSAVKRSEFYVIRFFIFN